MRAEPFFVEVSVTDTGMGIPREDLPFIFDDFYRAENAQKLKKDGMGGWRAKRTYTAGHLSAMDALANGSTKYR